MHIEASDKSEQQRKKFTGQLPSIDQGQTYQSDRQKGRAQILYHRYVDNTLRAKIKESTGSFSPKIKLNKMLNKLNIVSQECLTTPDSQYALPKKGNFSNRKMTELFHSLNSSESSADFDDKTIFLASGNFNEQMNSTNLNQQKTVKINKAVFQVPSRNTLIPLNSTVLNSNIKNLLDECDEENKQGEIVLKILDDQI